MILLKKPSIILLGRPQFRGRFRLRVKRNDGSIRLDTGWFPNLITNAGLNQLGYYSTTLTGYNVPYIAWAGFVGSGNTTPAYTDTVMTSLVSGTYGTAGVMGSGVVNASGTPPTITWTGTFAFPAGNATGTLAEVGVGRYITLPSTNPGTNGTYELFSHALIVDSGGNPTTITVLSNEELDVTYQLQEVVNTTLQTGTITIGTTTYNLSWIPYVGITFGNPASSAWTGTGSSASLTPYNGSIGSNISTGPSGTGLSGSGVTVSFATYTSGNYYVDGTWSATINDWNDPNNVGISAMTIRSGGWIHSYQIGISPAIPKTNFYSMTFTNRFAWARYP